MATTRNSAFYSSAFSSKYLQDARHLKGRVVPLPFEITIVSVSATGDIYNLTVIPANARVVGLDVVTDGLGASAGVGSMKIGDSGSDVRYMLQTDLHVTSVHGVLAVAGAGYTPTADTVVFATMVGAATVGKVVKGVLYVIPGA